MSYARGLNQRNSGSGVKRQAARARGRPGCRSPVSYSNLCALLLVLLPVSLLNSMAARCRCPVSNPCCFPVLFLCHQWVTLTCDDSGCEMVEQATDLTREDVYFGSPALQRHHHFWPNGTRHTVTKTRRAAEGGAHECCS